jgi:hypothetical protein
MQPHLLSAETSLTAPFLFPSPGSALERQPEAEVLAEELPDDA